MTSLDEFTKLLVKERQQQTLNMQAIDIGIGSDNDTTEAQTADVKSSPCACT